MRPHPWKLLFALSAVRLGVRGAIYVGGDESASYGGGDPGRLPKPVIAKRGMSATFEEFLMAAGYAMSEGNYEVILCERGVRTFSGHVRNTLDLSITPALRQASHLPRDVYAGAK